MRALRPRRRLRPHRPGRSLMNPLRRRRSVALFVAVALSALRAEAAGEPPTLLGFSAASSAAELEREKVLDAAISTDDLREWLRHLAARPHHVGSEWDRQNAEWMRDLFASWGYDARVES